MLWLATRETWPRAARVFCRIATAPGGDALEILERVPVRACTRRGPVIDLVLDRGVNKRAQFIFTGPRGRSTIFWQTPKASAAARPGVRIPAARATQPLTILVDSRERYGYRFADRGATIERRALPAGDYAVLHDARVAAAVERKTLDDLAASLASGRLAGSLAELAGLRAAAVVVEGTYSALLRHEHTRAGYLVDLIARLNARYPGVPIVFLESRKLAEEWTFRFLRAAHAEFDDPRLELSALLVPPEPLPLPQPRRRAKRPRPSVQ